MYHQNATSNNVHCHQNTPCFTRMCSLNWDKTHQNDQERIPHGMRPLHKDTPKQSWQSQKDCNYLTIHLHLHLLVSSALRGQSAGKPIQTFIQTISCGGACRLDEPLAMAKSVESQLLCHLCRRHCLWQVLSCAGMDGPMNAKCGKQTCLKDIPATSNLLQHVRLDHLDLQC